MELTDAWIRSATTDRRENVPDDGCPGLVLRLTPRGIKTFAVVYGPRGRRTYTIGRYPKVKLKPAREAAEKILARVTLGEDPPAEKLAARHAPPAETLSRLFERFFEAREPHLSRGTLSGYKG